MSEGKTPLLCRLGIHDDHYTGKAGHTDCDFIDFGDKVRWTRKRWRMAECRRCGRTIREVVEREQNTSNTHWDKDWVRSRIKKEATP